jgi:hypothetical protein
MMLCKKDPFLEARFFISSSLRCLSNLINNKQPNEFSCILVIRPNNARHTAKIGRKITEPS